MPIPDTTLVRRADNMRAGLSLPLPKPSRDALVADIWLDALCAIQRRGHAGTIGQALDEIEAAMERADALEAATAATV